MDNTWYYTLSTIVQSLASIFGLSATFLVFKLQTLDHELRQYRIKAIRTLAYFGENSESMYDDYSLIDVSSMLAKAVKELRTDVFMTQLKDGWHQEIKPLWTGIEGRILDTTEQRNSFIFLLENNAKIFENKVQYRLKLYSYALMSGLLLTFTILLALGMLSGLTHYLNFFHYSQTRSIFYITGFSFMGIVAVVWTAVYAIWGDKY